MNLAKKYKSTLNIAYKKYQQQIADDLLYLSKSDSKSFWKISINVGNSKTDIMLLPSMIFQLIPCITFKGVKQKRRGG